MRVLVLVACCAFPLLSHLGAVLAQPLWTAIGVALLAWALLSSRFGVLGAVVPGLLVLAVGLGLSQLIPAGVRSAPPVILNIGLGTLFAITLTQGREPMVSRFARIERGGNLPPDLVAYTRALTGLWAMFFIVMTTISVGLALWGSVTAWSLFTNVLNYVLVVAFFMLEYGYRRFRYRHYEHASPREILRRLHTYRVFPRPVDGS